MAIKIGNNILKDIGNYVKNTLSKKIEKAAIITDDIVDELYADEVFDSFKTEGFQVSKFVIPHGEESKNGENYITLLNDLAEIPMTRTDIVVALGGGVVGDLGGFVAATFLRGIDIIQVPTTVLAAVDSSVGGKTAINLEQGKNLAGAFHQPKLVWCDVKTFKTLPCDIFRDGMAEVIKYGIIKDREFFNQLKDKNNINIENVVRRCVDIKSELVEEDEHDLGVRQLLNYGHTIGHAIEKGSDFQVSHGSAVAKGIGIITDISRYEGWLSEEECDEIIEMLNLYDFDLGINMAKEEIIEIMQRDKKRKGKELDLVITEKIGTSMLNRVTMEKLEELIWKIKLR